MFSRWEKIFRRSVDLGIFCSTTGQSGSLSHAARSFEVLRAGLPPAPAYDLVYRHGLDIDATGERLAIGSTTGGVWISENRGDAWQCISAHLPPVYAVRFA